MKLPSILCFLALSLLLSACGGSSMRPTYSGKQESTAGVPGFVNGKKISPHVKLGQSYTIAGETYVPRHEPDYVEEGKASWYGPGFHDGKTANGERFDEDELTAAHRTLPLPSIVRVTMLSTGKQVVVRVNDRGPFAHSRIIDLSRGAAEKIGLLRAGVAKVRVEYMEEESRRFAQLMAQGRSPKSIDVASEVLGYDGNNHIDYARADVRRKSSEDTASVASDPANSNASFWDRFSPVRNAKAAPSNYPQEATQAAPVSEVESTDLSSPEPIATNQSMASNDQNDKRYSPFSALDAKEDISATTEIASLANSNAATKPAQIGETYVQLGAFQSQANAEKLRKQFGELSNLRIERKVNTSGTNLYHVRMGPYNDSEEANAALEMAENAGADARLIRE